MEIFSISLVLAGFGEPTQHYVLHHGGLMDIWHTPQTPKRSLRLSGFLHGRYWRKHFQLGVMHCGLTTLGAICRAQNPFSFPFSWLQLRGVVVGYKRLA